MTLELHHMRSLARVAVIAMLAAGASACSSVPNWANPTGWFGDDSQTAQDSANAGDASTPDLAAIPDKPATPSTSDERTNVSDSLIADRTDAQYSAEALRGGTEPSASPPAAQAPGDATASVGQPAPAETVAAETSSAPSTAAAPVQSAAPAAAQPPVASPSTSASPSSDAASATAEVSVPATSASAGEVAAPATSSDVTAAAPVAADASSESQLGFEPSKAPALDPNVARFVPQALLNQVAQPAAATVPAPVDGAPAKSDPAKSSANEGIPAAAPARVADGRSAGAHAAAGGMLLQASYTPGQAQHTATVFFSSDSGRLSAKARSDILAAAQAFTARGGSGFVRVVGHSSSRTPDMPLAQHMEVVFERSQSFATAVGNELIRDGIPADKVLIEAVGDSQPIYYESMPKGEAGNRRAEIFL